jgi:hypothetical protein
VPRVEVLRLLPVSPDSLFALMSNRSRWPAFYPDFVRFDGQPDASWDRPGDSATVVTRLLGREVAVEMIVEVFRPGRLVRYRSRQRGFPDATHVRAFIAHPEGCVFLAAVSYAARPGAAGIVDRLVVSRAITRKLRTAGENLARLAVTASDSGGLGADRARL